MNLHFRPATPEEVREAAFQTWWTTYGQPYEAAVIANGGTPWTTSIEERRAFWMRRYTRPAPPQGLFTDLADIRKPEYRTDTTTAIDGPESRSEPSSPQPPTEDTDKEIDAA